MFGTGAAEGSGPPCTQHSWGRKQSSGQGMDSLKPHCLDGPLSGEFPIIPNQLLPPPPPPRPLPERDGPGTEGAQPVTESGPACLPLCPTSTSSLSEALRSKRNHPTVESGVGETFSNLHVASIVRKHLVSSPEGKTTRRNEAPSPAVPVVRSGRGWEQSPSLLCRPTERRHL